jgi:hypothetical protein
MTTTIGSHLWLVDAVGHAGGTVVPAEWTRLRDRYYALQGHQHPMTDRLARAMADPASDADIDALYAGAVSEWWPNHVDSVMSVVAAHLYPALLALYAPQATKNYRTLADRFNESARALAAAAAAINLEANADAVLDNADKRAIDGWKSGPARARELDELLGPLSAAAVLAGAPGDPADGTLDQAQLLIPLVIADAAKHHRRKLYNRWCGLPDTHPELGPLTKQAYEAAIANPAQPPSPGRAGRWPALIALGAKLAAHPRPSELELIDPPRDHYIEWKIAPRGGYDVIRLDPEDQTPGLIDRIKTAAGIGGIPE